LVASALVALAICAMPTTGLLPSFSAFTEAETAVSAERGPPALIPLRGGRSAPRKEQSNRPSRRKESARNNSAGDNRSGTKGTGLRPQDSKDGKRGLQKPRRRYRPVHATLCTGSFQNYGSLILSGAPQRGKAWQGSACAPSNDAGRDSFRLERVSLGEHGEPHHRKRVGSDSSLSDSSLPYTVKVA
jgi:hypothetical protein